MSELLPVQGVVLAGGKSSRMGVDKAMLPFCGRPMVEIAVEKLRGFCAEVSVVGNRDDLRGFAPIVPESRVDAGPAAGIEAGLAAARQEWALFIPVDVPLVPGELLRRWCEEAFRVYMSVSYLGIWRKQPAFCLLRSERMASFTRKLDQGERRLEVLLNQTAEADDVVSWMYDEIELYEKDEMPHADQLKFWFSNVNTPEELEEVEAWAVAEADPLRG